VVQRVSSARVTVDGEITGAIERGLLVYLGVGKGDGEADRAWLLDKVLNLRIFPNDAGKMDKSVLDVDGALLVVSQFTLYADVRRGRRPGFDDAMPPAEAEAAYEAFLRDARASLRVATGRFGADMRVESVGDGPVTIWLDTAAVVRST
jgi:D-tyrosyl-tRNA(Tyr) deacylase